MQLHWLDRALGNCIFRRGVSVAQTVAALARVRTWRSTRGHGSRYAGGLMRLPGMVHRVVACTGVDTQTSNYLPRKNRCSKRDDLHVQRPRLDVCAPLRSRQHLAALQGLQPISETYTSSGRLRTALPMI